MNIPQVVIVGGGAGGLELATKLGKRLGLRGLASVTLVDQSPTHIWKPLLHEVAAGTINAFHDEQNYFIHAAKHHYEFQLGRMVDIDRTQRTIRLGPILGENKAVLVQERNLSYDVLVIAVGSTCNDFGTPGTSEHCIYLDTREKADYFHRQFLDNYIVAHSSADADLDKNKLSIAIVGAGATGVELAAELHYASQQYVSLGLDEIKAQNVSISLIEAGPRILPALSEKIAQQAMHELARIGVSVLTNEKVVEITAEAIKTASGKCIPSTLKAWCAGIKAPSFLRELGGLESNRINQLVVTASLQTTRDEHIFAMGDCAMCTINNTVVPPRAQAAHQQAILMADNIERYIKQAPLRSFVYKDRGSLISLSKDDSVGTLMGNLLGNVNIHGFLAKILYLSLYRNHQLSIHGVYKTLVLMMSDLLGRSTGQRTKLH